MSGEDDLDELRLNDVAAQRLLARAAELAAALASGLAWRDQLVFASIDHGEESL